jgi:hypothetical protein
MQRSHKHTVLPNTGAIVVVPTRVVSTLSAEDMRIASLTVAPTSKKQNKLQLGFTSLITPEGYAPKTDKGRARGYSTAIMYFAPADLSGYDVCQYRSAGCTASCLNTSGHGGIAKKSDAAGLNDIQRARIARTRLFFLNRYLFNVLLVRELTQHIEKARAAGMVPCIRLNGTSDLPWERLRLNDGRTILETFPDVVFYDYTKHPDRAIANATGQHPANYNLTFSRSEVNASDCERVLAADGNVAAVFKLCACGPKSPCKHYVPDAGLEYFGRPVVSGDHDDLRFLDPRGVVVGLKAKGPAHADHSGFVVNIPARGA